MSAVDDAAPIVIPAVLLALPAPTACDGFATSAVHELSLTARPAYEAAVAAASADWPLDQRHDAVRAALNVFNAHNFFGDLSDGEEAAVRPLLEHLGGTYPKLAYVLEDDGTGRLEDPQEAAECAAFEARQRRLRHMLAVDGEPAQATVRDPALLLALRGLVRALPPSDVWRMRALYRHQLCMSHKANALFLELAECVDAFAQSDDAQHLIEVGFIQSCFGAMEEAGATFFGAVKASGLELEETAILGVRTKYQTYKHVQSMLVAKSSTAAPATPARTPPVMIEGERQGHDLYDRPRDETSNDALAVQALHPRDHAAVLALCLNINNSNPHHGLTRHHQQTYVERLLVDPAAATGQVPFALRAHALLVRSRLEFQRSRVAQRSFLQLQEFIDMLDARRAPAQLTYYRADPAHLYSVAWPPVWGLKAEYGDLCFDTNLFKTALQTFEELQDWPSIIRCCKQLDRRRKAESLARALLAKDPQNPLLHVALGDATRDEAHLWKAWELCGGKMAAPMRSLATLANERQEWAKVVEYFDKAVAINPLFGGDWFTLGFAALKLSLFERACEAFTRVCQIDPDHAYAWSNLGYVLLQRKMSRPAFNAMSQALRNQRNNWQMWDNYWAVGVDLLEVSEAAHALTTAVGIAGRSFQMNRVVMLEFTAMVLRYIKGEIRMTDNVADSDSAAGGIAPFATAAAAFDDDGDEFAALAPLFGDVALEEPSSAAAEREAAAGAADEAARTRFVERTRALFDTMLGLYVSEMVLYECAAMFFGHLDGPRAAYEYRVKQVREAQLPLWERDDAKFKGVVAALTSMAGDAMAFGDGDAVKTTVLAIDSALAAAQEHMEDDERYTALQVLRNKVKKFKPSVPSS
jgi:tetratricopeptide (TPR) repeat protein